MTENVSVIFQVSPSSGTAIYKQIIDQVNRMVISGFLKSGDELPSVRQTAAKLEVNPMTISKAYSILEATGVLERIRGKGMIVSTDNRGSETVEKRLESLNPALKEAAEQAKQLALPNDIVIKIFKDLLEEKNE